MNKKKKVKLYRYLRVAWGTIFFGTLLMMILTPLIGSIHYILDLFSHYQLQYFVFILLLLPIGYVLKIDKRLLMATVFILIGHYFLLLSPVNLISANSYPKNPKMFFMNTNYYFEDKEDIINKIEEVDPQTVVIVEANTTMINGLTSKYGSPAIVNGEGGLRCAIFTKEDFVVLPISYTQTTYPVCALQIEQVNIIAIHPTPPLSQYFFDMQIEMFKEIDSYLSSIESENYILVGDFNSTSYNSVFRKYFGEIHKENNYSWEVGKPYMLPIDHVMSNFEIELYKTEKLSSDHVGIVVDY